MQKQASSIEVVQTLDGIKQDIFAGTTREKTAEALYELARHVYAAIPSVGKKDKAGDDTYKVLKVFPTKDDADGPLPKNLLKLVKKGGGAALVELLPPKGYKVKGDMLVSPDSSRPRYYIRAFGPSGSWDGFPVNLKPAQYKRLQSYEG